MIDHKLIKEEYVVYDGKLSVSLDIDWGSKTFDVFAPNGKNFTFLLQKPEGTGEVVVKLLAEAFRLAGQKMNTI